MCLCVCVCVHVYMFVCVGGWVWDTGGINSRLWLMADRVKTKNTLIINCKKIKKIIQQNKI